MRFEGKSEQDAIETALKELKRPASELRYHVVRDEKSFWGGRVVEIEVEAEGAAPAPSAPEPAPESPAPVPPVRAAAPSPQAAAPQAAVETPARAPRGPAQGRSSAEPG